MSDSPDQPTAKTEPVKLSDHDRAAVLFFIDNGRTPDHSKWGATGKQRMLNLLSALCFDGCMDRAEDAIQRLLYLGMIEDSDCSCHSNELAGAVPAGHGLPTQGMAEMGCVYCGERWTIDCSLGDQIMKDKAAAHSKVCPKNTTQKELRKMRAALEAIAANPAALIVHDIAVQALKPEVA